MDQNAIVLGAVQKVLVSWTVCTAEVVLTPPCAPEAEVAKL